MVGNYFIKENGNYCEFEIRDHNGTGLSGRYLLRTKKLNLAGNLVG